MTGSGPLRAAQLRSAPRGLRRRSQAPALSAVAVVSPWTAVWGIFSWRATSGHSLGPLARGAERFSPVMRADWRPQLAFRPSRIARV
jgi:hypothetical protein